MASTYSSESYKSAEFCTSWNTRIVAANTQFNKWEKRFKCKILNKYFEGKQWEGEETEDGGFVVNLIYATWKTKKPSLLFREPRCQFSANPAQSDWNVEAASKKAKLATNLVNTLIQDPRMQFSQNASMCLLDSGSYFGILEIGYSAKWIDNPNAGLPEVSTDYDPSKEIKTKEPEQIPESEWLYVKRIIPERFRVGGNWHWDLEKNSWVGYYEWYRPEDIKEALGNDFEQNYSGRPAESEINPEELDKSSGISSYNYHKVWKIWDLRCKKCFYYDQTAQKALYKPIDFERLPLKMLLFDSRRKGAYPIPLFYNWKSPQDDFNESMEQVRAHRRRSKTIYQAPKGTLDQENKDKFRNLPDQSILETNPGPDRKIAVVPNNSLDQSIIGSVQMSKDNLNIVSGVSSDIRGESDRVTATQASISAKAGSVREFSEREIVAMWLAEICLEILNLAIERIAFPIWVKLLQDTNEMGTEVKVMQEAYQLITTDELEGFGYRAHISMDSMSPITNDEEKTKFLEFLAVLHQYPIFSLNPVIIRELAMKLGYNNEEVIKALQEQALKTAQMQMAQSGGNGGSNSNVAQKTVEQMMPPGQGQIENQLANSGVPVQ